MCLRSFICVCAARGIQWKGDRLRLALFLDREAGIEPVWEELEVLYEDDFCLVAHKPAGMAVHPDGSGLGVTLDHLVAAHYVATGVSAAVRHIHRLDKDTTGPVMYAKNEFAQLVLDENMREKASRGSTPRSSKAQCRLRLK